MVTQNQTPIRRRRNSLSREYSCHAVFLSCRFGIMLTHCLDSTTPPRVHVPYLSLLIRIMPYSLHPPAAPMVPATPPLPIPLPPCISMSEDVLVRTLAAPSGAQVKWSRKKPSPYRNPCWLFGIQRYLQTSSLVGMFPQGWPNTMLPSSNPGVCSLAEVYPCRDPLPSPSSMSCKQYGLCNIAH